MLTILTLVWSGSAIFFKWHICVRSPTFCWVWRHQSEHQLGIKKLSHAAFSNCFKQHLFWSLFWLLYVNMQTFSRSYPKNAHVTHHFAAFWLLITSRIFFLEKITQKPKIVKFIILSIFWNYVKWPEMIDSGTTNDKITEWSILPIFTP